MAPVHVCSIFCKFSFNKALIQFKTVFRLTKNAPSIIPIFSPVAILAAGKCSLAVYFLNIAEVEYALNVSKAVGNIRRKMLMHIRREEMRSTYEEVEK